MAADAGMTRAFAEALCAAYRTDRPIAEQLTLRTPTEQAILKAHVHAKTWNNGHGSEPRVIYHPERPDLRLTVSEVQAPFRKGYNMLECRAFLEVKVGKKWLYVLADPNGHYRFGNPPTMVPDGTTSGILDAEGKSQTVVNFKEDPLAAFQTALWETVLLVARRTEMRPVSEGIPQGPFPDNMTTDTFYSNASDGYIRSGNADYATCQAGSGLLADSSEIFAGQKNAPYYIWMGALWFATETIDDAAVASAAILALYCWLTGGTVAGFTCTARVRDWGDTLTTGDWVVPGSLSALTLVAHAAVSSSTPTNAYTTFTDDALAQNITKTAHTRLILSSDTVEAGTAPSTSEYIEWRPAETSGTTQDPKLVVSYTIPSPPAITSVSPNSGPLVGGPTVAITGTDLTGATGVVFGAYTPTTWSVISNTEIDVSGGMVGGASPGTVDVRVTTPGGQSAVNAGDEFTFVNPVVFGPRIRQVQSIDRNMAIGSL